MINKLKTALTFAALLAVFTVSGQAKAAFITPTGATASGWYNPSYIPDRLIDSSGLSTNSVAGTHDNPSDAQGMWLAGIGNGVQGVAPIVADQYVVFDLGSLYDLTQAYIWNQNQLHASDSYLDRGTEDFCILVSSDSDPNTAIFTNLGLSTLVAASGTATDPAQVKALVASNVRLVKFDIKTALSGNANEYVGLSEVRFEGVIVVPEPATSALALTALLLTFGRRRTR